MKPAFETGITGLISCMEYGSRWSYNYYYNILLLNFPDIFNNVIENRAYNGVSIYFSSSTLPFYLPRKFIMKGVKNLVF